MTGWAGASSCAHSSVRICLASTGIQLQPPPFLSLLYPDFVLLLLPFTSTPPSPLLPRGDAQARCSASSLESHRACHWCPSSSSRLWIWACACASPGGATSPAASTGADTSPRCTAATRWCDIDREIIHVDDRKDTMICIDTAADVSPCTAVMRWCVHIDSMDSTLRRLYMDEKYMNTI